MSERPGNEDLVAVMVPRRHLTRVYAFLGSLADDQNSKVEDLPGPPQGPANPSTGLDIWSENDFRELIADKRPSTQRIVRVLDVLAERPDMKVSTTALSEATRLTRGELRGGFSGFTRVCKSFPGGAKYWPIKWSWGAAEVPDLDTETYYEITAGQAETWKRVRAA